MDYRKSLAALTLSASAFVGLAVSEGYTDRAVQPLPGDKWTNGFGSTTNEDGSPIKPGQATNPVRAMNRMLVDVQRFEGAVRQCVHVPLTQAEYDAHLSLAYNIGAANFCGSTLVKRLNALDYAGACAEILRWNRFQGIPIEGLIQRRQREHAQCMQGVKDAQGT